MILRLLVSTNKRAKPSPGEILGKALATSSQRYYNDVASKSQRKPLIFQGLQRKFNVYTMPPIQDHARFRS